ncbi:metal ABC transporter permease [Synechococcus sp. UW140]|uniref:metal ABC transporter permease n=1 Tax=Synechococcus sp. UW140 TaxID=368503 RepID=UPI000B6C8625|nr:metal ABC transporter permease [Synechococcus sp. UW140]OUW48725.1 MAG: manganese ABC transporter [Synechococcus sp. TMED187]RZO12482.1 MAG: metal ABC transporter permease [Synechococcus sp. MED-G135]
MPWWFLPLLMALMVGLLCPATGTLLVTQRRLLQSNLISHAVLPGLAVALALGLDPALGGVLSGVLGALVAERLQRRDGRSHEAVINTVLAGFLGLGVLLIPLLNLRLDLEAVLFGDLLAVGSSDLLRTLIAAASLLLLVVCSYRSLVYLGVDPDGAAAVGLPVRGLRLALAFVTALVVVSAMAAVGVVLVIALLCAPVLPGLHRVTSLRAAMLRSSLVGMALSGAGFALALLLNLPPGPLIGVACLGLLLPGSRIR